MADLDANLAWEGACWFGGGEVDLAEATPANEAFEAVAPAALVAVDGRERGARCVGLVPRWSVSAGTCGFGGRGATAHCRREGGLLLLRGHDREN